MTFSEDYLEQIKKIVNDHHPTESIAEKGIGWWHIEYLLTRLEAAENVCRIITIMSKGWLTKENMKTYAAWQKSKGL